MELRLGVIAVDPASADPSQARTIRDRFMTLTRFLYDNLPASVLEPLSPELREAWRPLLRVTLEPRQVRLESLRETIIAKQEKRLMRDLRADMAAELSTRLNKAAILIRAMVPLPSAEFVKGVLLAVADTQIQFGDLAEAEREQAITEALKATLTAETKRLDRSDLSDDLAALDAASGSHGAGLTDLERRFLAVASRCAVQQDLQKFGVLELACGVEHALLSRLLKPLQTAFRDGLHQHRLTKPKGRDALHAYITGQATFMMLGQLVSAYEEALKRIDERGPPMTAGDELASWLARQPSAAALRSISNSQTQQRCRSLGNSTKLASRSSIQSLTQTVSRCRRHYLAPIGKQSF